MLIDMEWQQAVSLAIVAGAGAGLAWGLVQRRKLKFGRGAHCGCAGVSAPQSTITFRARKGQRPEVRFKM